jgi:ribosomal protein S6--L-glutamate ligase
MKNIVVINGEDYWGRYLPGYNVVRRRLQDTRWILTGTLHASDPSGAISVDGILWRLGAVKPHPQHRTLLEMVRLAGIPCLSSADVLLRGYDRLSMLNELKQAGLPVADFEVVVGDRMLGVIRPDFPAVVKVGNYHGGFGKVLIHSEEQWTDLVDLSFVTDEYITVEPYIDYVRDIRTLAVGDRIWGMSRQGRYWKVNQLTTGYALMDLPEELIGYTRRAMAHLGTEVLALDILEDKEGRYTVLESNDTPGLTGFPDEVKVAIGEAFGRRMEQGRS